ncbi:protein of unknown function [Actinokineospora alba]|uniref:eCIS core domain-containing protein n=1 Tax=Actinokineospora alba TaxID=504798 RepID=A0A1H0F690_9PSEU|nr:uncharacterized protein DUF4157 [Actinokineospora alba]SDI18593.1 protein of unknown function [Actinokineospora alba]SDN90079.1 protein of unknown function [Actinokineospora alba]
MSAHLPDPSPEVLPLPNALPSTTAVPLIPPAASSPVTAGLAQAPDPAAKAVPLIPFVASSPVTARSSPPVDTTPTLSRPTTPVYRAALDVLPPRVEETTPPPGGEGATVTVSVPGEVAGAFRTHFGVDVSTVAIHRGPAVSKMATSLAAKAFAHGGDVYLPDELGDVSSHDARSLLAHELVHATQQRMLGGGLPTEDSAEGRQLEEAAVATEQWFRGARAEPPTLIHRPAPAAVTADELAAYVRGMGNELAALPSSAEGTFVQRAQSETQTHVVDELRRIIESGETDGGSHFSPAGIPAMTEPPGPRIEQMSLPQGDSGWSSPIWVEPSRDHEAVAVMAPVLAEMAAATKRIDQLEGSLAQLNTHVAESEVDLHSPRSMDALADKLYRHVRSRLRHELIIDRERSGRLTDFR